MVRLESASVPNFLTFALGGAISLAWGHKRDFHAFRFRFCRLAWAGRQLTIAGIWSGLIMFSFRGIFIFAGAVLFNMAVALGASAGEFGSASLFAASEATARVGPELRWHAVSTDSILAQHDIVLDLGSLRGDSKSTQPADLPSSRVSVGHVFETLLPDIFRPVQFQVDEVAEYVPGVVSYSGRALDIEGATFTFSEKEGRVLGKIMLGQLSFVIEPSSTKPNYHVLTVLDRGLFPSDPHHALRQSTSADWQPEATMQAMGLGTGEVRVLFLFANNISNPSLMAANIVSEFNAALTRSGVASANRLSSANVRVVSSAFSGSND